MGHQMFLALIEPPVRDVEPQVLSTMAKAQERAAEALTLLGWESWQIGGVWNAVFADVEWSEPDGVPRDCQGWVGKASELPASLGVTAIVLPDGRVRTFDWCESQAVCEARIDVAIRELRIEYPDALCVAMDAR